MDREPQVFEAARESSMELEEDEAEAPRQRTIEVEPVKVIDLSDEILREARRAAPGATPEKDILLEVYEGRPAEEKRYGGAAAIGAAPMARGASDDWYSDGLVRAPRLRTKASKSPPMSENFNNVAFAHAFSVHKVAFYLVSEQDFVQYALYFSAFWTAWTRAGKGCEIPNFKGSYLGRFPLVLADFWTSDHLSERSRT